MTPDLFTQRLDGLRDVLRPAELRLARRMALDRRATILGSVSAIAARWRTSGTTVLRTVRALGYADLQALQADLLDGMVGREAAVAAAEPVVLWADLCRAALVAAGEEVAMARRLIAAARLVHVVGEDAARHLAALLRRRGMRAVDWAAGDVALAAARLAGDEALVVIDRSGLSARLGPDAVLLPLPEPDAADWTAGHILLAEVLAG